MDIVAHALWVGVGANLLKKKRKVSGRTLWTAIALTVLPDIVSILPIFIWSILPSNSFETLYQFVIATPGSEPTLPESLLLIAHHLHCTMHSAVVAGVVTLIVWVAARRFPIALLGWWMHIIIDVFTHSKEYYAVPVLYPITEKSFNGIAWISPWALALNYSVLVIIYFWFYFNKNS